MNTLRIRDAGPDDRAAVIEVTLAAYEQYAVVVPAHWESYRQNILATLGFPGQGTQIVADEDGRLVGAVLLYPAGSEFTVPGGRTVTLREPEVRLLAVVPAARGRGVGVELMRECMRRARDSRAATLTLHTLDMMQAAMRMYERLGFQRAPALDIQPAPGVTIKGYRLVLETAAS